jgi:hypothetical protein
MKSLVKLSPLATIALGALISCSEFKTVVKAPKVNIDPPLKEIPAQAAGEDPLAGEQWNFGENKTNMAKAWEISQGGSRRVRIGVLSSGVDYNHEDLRANLWVNAKENAALGEVQKVPVDMKDNDGNGYIDDTLGWDVIDSDGFPFDTLGDGTSAAGVLAATHANSVGIKGMLQQATVIPVRYIDSTGTTSVAKLTEGLRYLRSMTDSKPDVVLVQMANIDFKKARGGDFEAMEGMAMLSEQGRLKEELDLWKAAGTPIVVSAGNRASDVASVKSVINEFSNYPNVIVVTNVDKDDQKPFTSNYGIKHVHTAAPGVDITTTLPFNQYGKVKGSFIAATHVAGALALAISSHHGKLQVGDYVRALISGPGSDPVDGLANITIGGNRLNVAKFLASLNK